MSLGDELAFTSAAELAARIRRRELSPVEVMEACLTRIETRNSRLTAFVHLAFDEARERARAAEQAVMDDASLGPLHGVPVGMKDNFDHKPGWPSTLGGVRALHDHIADSYCPFAERIERAGAIIVGKTNSPVFGFRGTCDNYLFGPSRNPFDLTRNTGGSSGGSAAAVAGGLVPLSEGTDGGGSIRIPAAWCGAYGFKPSFGRTPMVSRPNALGNIAPFLFEGPITRTVEDATIALNALAGHDRRDPFSIETSEDFTAALNGSIVGWRIAFSPDFDIFPVEPEIAAAVEEAVQVFEAAGAQIERVRFKLRHSHEELSALWCRLVALLNLRALDDLRAQGVDLLRDHPDDLPLQLHQWLEIGRGMSALDYLRDQSIQSEVFDAIHELLDDYRILVTPTLACSPVINATDGNTVGPSSVAGRPVDPLLGWCLTYPVNFAGSPAASVPIGLLSDGLPVGMQIVGRRYADRDVLTASAAFERLRPWHHHYARLDRSQPPQSGPHELS